jgi:exonuclease SbcC
MRLHHLRATAFGPFAGTIEVDFDQLGEAGLFLLTGATGAGKTSVLDAVCFGLYGEVPGDRHQARHLRSDHAAPDVAPEVVLTVSVSGRTLRLTRSPAWDRPRKRRPGTTRQPARVVVEERVGGEWRGLTTRLDDAGLLVGDLLGMTCTQFTQVALLPQGRFQAFLRATSAERHAVLQRLFRTDRFERVEQWLVDRRVALRRESQVAHGRVAGLVHRVQEAAEEPVPDEWDLEDLTGPAGDGTLVGWVDDLVARVGTQAVAASATAEVADTAATSAAEALAAGRALAERRARAATAERERARLDARTDEIAALRAALAGHHRAAPVGALVTRVRAAERACRQAHDRTAAVLAEAGLEGATTAEVDTHRLAAVRAHSLLEACRPREQALEAARAAHADADRRLADAEQRLAGLTDAAASLPARRAEAAAALETARATAARLPVLEADLARAEAGHRAAVELTAVTARLAEARERQQQAVDRAQDLREAYLTAREHRIASMAGELAGALVSGCACPVCGSADHPAPAPTTDGSTRAQEDAARHEYETAEAERLVHAEVVASLTARVATLTETAGGRPAAAWAEAVTAARAAHADGTRRAAEVAGLLEVCRALDDEADDHEDRVRAATADRAAARAEIERLAAQVADLDAELAGHRGDFDSIAAAAASAQRRADRLADLAAELAARDRAQAAFEEAVAAAGRAAEEAGFADLQAVERALLTAPEVAAAEQELDAWTRADAAVEEVLADPEVRAAQRHDPPDLDALVHDARTAAEAHRRAEGLAARLEERRRRLVDLRTRVVDELDAWAPLRESLEVAAGLASFVEGKSADNPLRMRLSAYVLGERLRQVVAAANARLARMSGQRYSLEHTDERGVGAQRGGLSLLVRDDWSGVLRDPATLSGGETFVVSLALALGLADTVAHEAGGATIDTLFVDEGFGSLDADTLEDVMGVLDGLREGGRVVGVVSHVAELRDRITTQLEVRKGRRGSEVVAH